MKKYSTFIFDSYDWHPTKGVVSLHYSLDDEVKFTETLTLPSVPTLKLEKEEECDRALLALHLIGGISYYKTCLPKKMEIRSGTLSAKQAEFWNSVYENGLGEFFYKNAVDFTGLIDFPSNLNVQDLPSISAKPVTRNPKLLVPVGGGKDSIVTTELLRGKSEITLFRMGHHPLIDQLAKTAGLPLLTINRALAPELFKLNEEGALNGHIPITAYLSCVTILISLVYDFDAVAMSSEKSANVGNVQFKGREINHQWSKSEEFERLFREYVSAFITNRVEYFSPLRSMNELEIVREFVKYPQYFHFTTSCNTNWKINKDPQLETRNSKPGHWWCGRCPKCAFVFALYAAFLPRKTLLEIFGKNLFDDPALISLYRELLGLEGSKPFECVGTPEETREAFARARKTGEWEQSTVMKMFTKEFP